jgi:hypothetical protein
VTFFLGTGSSVLACHRDGGLRGRWNQRRGLQQERRSDQRRRVEEGYSIVCADSMLVEELIVFHQQASIHIETTVAYVSIKNYTSYNYKDLSTCQMIENNVSLKRFFTSH